MPLISVQGDPNSHGAGALDASINPGTVFINGIELVVVGSTAAPDSLCPSAGGTHCGPSSASGSPNVFAFGIPVHRHGDSRLCGASNVVTGQSNVFANGT